ncbi:RES family NAD+ phosphorylase [Catenovulum agarivorans]|uniref:RES family NAD+ phosphorylase n=1 Tax=Catenovulum agarivorans TaxID=1172192 RepID=UPI0003147283|nr:RES family NAD+ phosphorylase [Catenovulum agarivorans]
MISIYRIVKKKWAASAFDGEGARLFGGRWNNKGKACVYAASSESLALLEILVHLESDAILNSYTLLKSKLPPTEIMTLGTLPQNWRAEPAPAQTAVIGDQWLKSEQSLALQVPSVIVPREYNYLINPLHPAMKTVLASVEEIEISIDSRLV